MFESAPAAPLDPRLLWKVIPVPKPSGLRAWKVGPHVGVWTHHVGVSQPCWSRLTDGAVLCPHCVDRERVRWIAYLPVCLRSTLHQRVIIISRTAGPVSDSIPIGSPVRFSPPATRGLPTLVAADDGDMPPESERARISTRPPADIRPYLLHLWGVPELLRHYG